ncbi:MAG: translation initiation factor IF-1 [Verrucomicrobiota bacterium]
MDKDNDTVELEGTIHTVLPGTMFRVELDGGHLVLAHISGKMRKRFIRLVAGDRVKIEMSPYDTEKARIVYRVDARSSGPGRGQHPGRRRSPRSMARPGQPKKRAKPNPTPRRGSGGGGGSKK